MPRRAATELPPDDICTDVSERNVKKATPRLLARELRIATMVAYDMVGGVKYLKWLAKHYPPVYAELLKKCMGSDAQAEGTGEGTTIVVRQLTIDARPVPGVINSPIAGHIAGPQLPESTGEVIDAVIRNG